MNKLDNIYKKTGLNTVDFSKGYVNHLIELLQNLDHNKVLECLDQLEEASEDKSP